MIISSSVRKFATEAKFILKPYKYHKLDPKSIPDTTTIKAAEAVDMYTQMMTIRRMETFAAQLYRKKLIRGFCHLYIGQEAVAVGINSAMRKSDSIVTSYRCHAWAYLMTKDLKGCLAELLGAQSGLSKGKGGSMHMYSNNFYGGNAIVGAQTAQGAGIALAHQYLENGGASVTAYGDGAANQGQLYEAFNMAKLWKLPCIFLCENNQYAMGTSLARGAGSSDFFARGDYIPGIWVDGMDVLSVREAAKFAFEYCSSGKGPLVMEAYTYRFTGHSMSDPDTSYRTRDEIQQKRQTSDPVKVFQDRLLSVDLVTKEQIKEIDDQAKKAVDAASQVVLKDKELPIAKLTHDILAKNIEKQVRGVDPWSKWAT